MAPWNPVIFSPVEGRWYLKFPIIYRVSAPFQVVGNGISAINSITQIAREGLFFFINFQVFLKCQVHIVHCGGKIWVRLPYQVYVDDLCWCFGWIKGTSVTTSHKSLECFSYQHLGWPNMDQQLVKVVVEFFNKKAVGLIESWEITLFRNP